MCVVYSWLYVYLWRKTFTSTQFVFFLFFLNFLQLNINLERVPSDWDSCKRERFTEMREKNKQEKRKEFWDKYQFNKQNPSSNLIMNIIIWVCTEISFSNFYVNFFPLIHYIMKSHTHTHTHTISSEQKFYKRVKGKPF